MWRIELSLTEAQAPFDGAETQALLYTIACDNADDAMRCFDILQRAAHRLVSDFNLRGFTGKE